jgi:hypothetical protein
MVQEKVVAKPVDSVSVERQPLANPVVPDIAKVRVLERDVAERVKMQVRRKCKQCGKEFTFCSYPSKGTKGQFCSRECYYRYIDSTIREKCPECGQMFEYPKWKHKKFCSQSCASKHYQKTPSAYRPKKSAGPKNRYRQARSVIDGRRITIHRALMEQKLRKRLKSSEHVHHIDMNPSNNTIENLYLYKNASEHSKGHRTIDATVHFLLDNGIIGFESGKYYLKDKAIG